MNDLLEEIRPIFADILGSEAVEQLTPATSAHDVEGWDSFAHISIVVEVEERYKVRFTTEELGRLTNVGDFVTLLDAKIKGK